MNSHWWPRGCTRLFIMPNSLHVFCWCLLVCLFAGPLVLMHALTHTALYNSEHPPSITMLQSLLLPEGSVAVTRTIVRPTGNLDPDRTTAPVNTLTWCDMSTWSPVPSTAVTLYSTAASLVPGSAFIVPEGWVQVTEGLLVSYIEFKNQWPGFYVICVY